MLSCLLFMVLSHVAAQPVCETVRDDVDEFTDKRVIQITSSNFSQGPAFDWFAVNGDICLRLHWAIEDRRPAVVFEGDTLMLKLENDTVIILTSTETTVGKQVVGDDGTKRTQAIYCYGISPEQLLMVNHFWVQKFRIYFREGHQDFEAMTDPGWQMGLWRSSNCIRKALSIKADPSIISTFGQTRVWSEPGN